jgi:hypothetical protein
MPGLLPPKNLLLVEGSDDKEVVYQLSNRDGIPRGSFEAKAKTGYSNLIETLEVELSGSELERLGVLVDADFNLAARWQSIRDRLLMLGYDSVPDQPVPGGAIVHHSTRPSVGIWVMPDNGLPGMLEDFAANLIPLEDNLWQYACDCVRQISASDCRFPRQHEIKAQLHTWLAWQEEPGRPIGLAIKMRYLNAETPQAEQFLAWLRRLFNL